MPKPTVIEAFSPRSSKNIKSPLCELFYTPKEIRAFGYPDSPIVRGSRFGDPHVENGSLWENEDRDYC